jgi:hypothetical protein
MSVRNIIDVADEFCNPHSQKTISQDNNKKEKKR